MTKRFGNLGKGDFIYKYHTCYRSDRMYLYVYKITERKAVIKDYGFGRKESLVELTIHPFRYMANITKYQDDFYCPNKTETITLGASLERTVGSRCKTEVWVADLQCLLQTISDLIAMQTRASEDNRQLFNFYSKFLKTKRPFERDYWKRMYIGAFAKNERGNYPKLVTWNQLKKMYQDNQLDYKIESMLDWNECFSNGFVKFKHDPYSGMEVDWGRISDELSEMLGKKVRI